MKIGFFGTPDIASYCLNELLKEHTVSFAVTPCDKPVGRNRQIQFCPAKDLAMCHGIPLLQPESLKDPAFMEELRKYEADIFVVVAYGKLIPAEVFEYPRLKTINLHPSLLPKYRGAAPIQWALINGETRTGVSVQLINERMDAGDVVLQKEIDLDQDINAGGLYEKVLPVGARLLKESISLLASGEAKPFSQNEDDATYCGRITRDTAHIDWNDSAMNIHNLVRGLNPKPVAWTTFRGQNLKIYRTSPVSPEEDIQDGPGPGAIMRYHKKRLIAGTGSGFLELLELQPETKKRMDALSFINGQRIEGKIRLD